MTTPNLYEVEIFIAGTRPASNGVSTTITPADLQEVVDTYNPKYFRAPLIVSETLGHDIGNYTDATISKSKELCHGIPKTLRRVGDRLYAGFEKVSSDFAQWVRDKQIHSLSSSFYLPNSPNNPYPGKWSLRHIAGLGTTPPACKGLAPLPEPPAEWQEAGGRRQEFEPYIFSFNESEEGVVNFGMVIDSPWAIAADLFQRFREFLIESEDLETAERVLPADQITALRNMADLDASRDRQIMDLQAQIAMAKYNDFDYEEGMDYKSKAKKMKMSAADIAEASGLTEIEINAIMGGQEPSAKQKKALDAVFMEEDDDEVDMAEMRQREADLKAREEAITNRERALEYREVSSFVEGLVNQGKVKAAKREDTITLLMNTPNNTEVEFSQATGKKTPRQALMAELGDRPAWNFSGAIVKEEDDPVNPDFSEGRTLPGATPESVQQHQAVISWCKKNNKDPNSAADYSEAMLALRILY